MGYFLKASFVDSKSLKLTSKLEVSSAAKKHTSDKRTSAEKKNLCQKALKQRENRKCRVGFLTQLKLKSRPSFPGIPKIINTKINSKNQQSGDDYTTPSTTTKITRGKP